MKLLEIVGLVNDVVTSFSIRRDIEPDTIVIEGPFFCFHKTSNIAGRI